MKNINHKLGALADLAFDPKETLGRRHSELGQCPYQEFKDPFQIDIERIRNGEFFPRLEDKTQAFFVNHYRNVKNRKSHTEEVVRISSYVASSLGLNVNLTKAIAYGHDLGHIALGHLGEEIVSRLTGEKFSHATMGVVVAQEMDNGGKGLNLCYETLLGILEHSSGNGNARIPHLSTLEASVVLICDKIAAVFSDLSDAIRIGCLKRDNIPWNLLDFLGRNQRERMINVIRALIAESASRRMISLYYSKEAVYFQVLKSWVYNNVYPDTRNVKNWHQEEEALYRTFEIFSQDPAFKEMDPIFLLTLLNDRDIAQVILKEGRILKDKNSEFARLALSLKDKNWRINIFSPNLSINNFKKVSIS